MRRFDKMFGMTSYKSSEIYQTEQGEFHVYGADGYKDGLPNYTYVLPFKTVTAAKRYIDEYFNSEKIY